MTLYSVIYELFETGEQVNIELYAKDILDVFNKLEHRKRGMVRYVATVPSRILQPEWE